MQLDGLPLSPKQISSIGLSDARINIWDGAIRSGKTFSSLMRFLIYVATAPPGEIVVAGRTTYTVSRNVFAPLGDPAIFGPLAGLCSYTAGAPTGMILGRRVHVIGANDARAETKLRGLTCAGAYVDEVTLASREFFVQLLGRMSVPGAQLFGTTNADAPSHWLKQEFLDRAAVLNLKRFQFELYDNPSLSPEYIDSIESEFTGMYYLRFVKGEWVAADGAVYSQWNPAEHVVDSFPSIIDWVSVGVDYGTTNPFSAILIGLGTDMRLYAVSEYRFDSKKAHRQMTDAEYSVAMRGWLRDININGQQVNAVPRRIELDPSAASFREQLFRDKLTPHRADNTVGDGIRVISTLLSADKLKIGRSCTGLLEEFPAYCWDNKAAERGEDKVLKTADHSLDALRYGVYSTRRSWSNKLGLATI